MSDPKYAHIGTPEDRLIEECGEILQAIGKGKRFGWNNHHPDRKTTNLEDLANEINDLIKAFNDLNISEKL